MEAADCCELVHIYTVFHPRRLQSWMKFDLTFFIGMIWTKMMVAICLVEWSALCTFFHKMEWFQRWNIEALSQLNEKDACCVYWRFWVQILAWRPATLPVGRGWDWVDLYCILLFHLLKLEEYVPGLLKKGLKPLIYFSQNQQEMYAIFFGGWFWISRWLLQHRGTKHFLARVQGVV